MMVMPSNNTGKLVKKLHRENPGKIGLMMNPRCIRPSQFEFPYAIDNDCFQRFDEKQYFKILNYSKNYQPPLFIVCPDVVGCHDRTLALWNYYHPILKKYGYPIAFVCQDGCEPELVPECDWIFIGGKDPWKMDNLHKFTNSGKPVHVGRVNGIGRLRYCEALGVKSVDGTGWMMFRDKKHYDLLDWLSGAGEQIGLPTY